MQAAVEDLSSEQIHEDSQAAKENRQTEEEKLEDSGDHDELVPGVAGIIDANTFDLPIHDFDEEPVLSIRVLVMLTMYGSAGPRLPSNYDWRFSQGTDDLFLAHSRFDCEQGLRGENFLPLPRNAGCTILLALCCDSISDKEQDRQECNQVNPDSASGEKCLLDFQANHRPDLRPPELVHRTTSSLPIRYS